jgi:hypothetical protein
MVPSQKVQGDIAEFFRGLSDLESEERGVTQEPLIVLQHLEDEELLLRSIPIGPDSLENGRTIVEGIGHDGDLGFGFGHEIPVQVDDIHSLSPSEYG